MGFLYSLGVEVIAEDLLRACNHVGQYQYSGDYQEMSDEMSRFWICLMKPESFEFEMSFLSAA